MCLCNYEVVIESSSVQNSTLTSMFSLCTYSYVLYIPFVIICCERKSACYYKHEYVDKCMIGKCVSNG